MSRATQLALPASRRDLLGAASTLLLLGAAEAGPAKAAELDAELIRVCAAFDELERAYIALDHGAEIDSPEELAAEAEGKRICEAQEPLVEFMVETRATTREGIAARARSLALWDAELMKEDGPDDVGDRLTRAIIRDLMTGSAAA